MSYIHVNGYPVPVAHGSEVAYEDIAGGAGYSFNGVYQYGRNGIARAWRFRTSLLSRAEALALVGMLQMRGDAWRWPLLGTAPDGVHYIVDADSVFGWSDKRRVPTTSKAKATVLSAYGSDGARVYDWNRNAMAPFSGCEGSLLVDEGATNKAVASVYNANATTEFAALNSASIATTTNHHWEGTSSIQVSVSPSGSAEGVRVQAVSSVIEVAGGHTMSAFVKFGKALVDNNETLTVEYYNKSTPVGIAVASTTLTPTVADAWYRVQVQGVGTTGIAQELRLYISGPGVFGAFYVDGVQIETQPTDGYPTAPVDPGSDPWGSGNGVRPAGLLNLPTWLNGFEALTVAAWVNVQYLSSGASRFVFDSSDGAPKTQIFFNGANSFGFDVLASDGSTLRAQGAAVGTGWHHVVGTYNPGDKTARLYVDGALAASDASWSGNREFYDPAGTLSDFSFGGTGAAGANTLKVPLGPIQFYPFAAPLELVQGWYNSGADDAPVPGIMPLAVHGDVLSAGDTEVYCYGQVERVSTVPHKPEATGTWEDGACTVQFTLREAEGRQT